MRANVHWTPALSDSRVIWVFTQVKKGYLATACLLAPTGYSVMQGGTAFSERNLISFF